jgi:hypothetical protein
MSPSAASRWLECGQSVIDSRDVVRISSHYADEGSEAHELARFMLSGGVKPEFKYDYESIKKHTQSYVAYANRYKFNMDTWWWECEYEVQIPAIQGIGTVDLFCITAKVLHIFDLKYGKSRVEAANNPQLKLYASGILNILDNITEIEQVVLHICQPRINKNGLYKKWSTTPNDILQWVDDTVNPTVESINRNQTHYRIGRWCWFCPVRSRCFYLLTKEIEEEGLQDEEI